MSCACRHNTLVAQKTCRRRVCGGNLLRSALCHDKATAGTAGGTHVDKIIGHSHHVEIMLYDKYGIAPLYKFVQYAEQRAYIIEMQTRSGFVKNKKCAWQVLSPVSLAGFHLLKVSTKAVRALYSRVRCPAEL